MKKTTTVLLVLFIGFAIMMAFVSGWITVSIDTFIGIVIAIAIIAAAAPKILRG